MKNSVGARNTDVAVAVSYDEASDCAPEVSAVGTNELAKTMIRVARRAGVPIAEDSELANRLSQLDSTIGADVAGNLEIPQSLYYEVAKLLVTVNKNK